MKTRHVLVIVVLASLLQLVAQVWLPAAGKHWRHPALITSPTSLPGSPPVTIPLAPPLQGSPRDFAASVLAVKPEVVTGLRLLPREQGASRDIQWTWECRVGGRKAMVSALDGCVWWLRPAPGGRAHLRPRRDLHRGARRGGRPRAAAPGQRLPPAWSRTRPTPCPEATSTSPGRSPRRAASRAASPRSRLARPGRSGRTASAAAVRSWRAARPADRRRDGTATVPPLPSWRACWASAGTRYPLPVSTGCDTWKYAIGGSHLAVSHRPWTWEVAARGPRPGLPA